MRYFTSFILVLLLASCASVSTVPDFSRVGKLWASDGTYGTAFPVAYANDGFYVLTCRHVAREGLGFDLDLDGIMYYGGQVTWADEDEDLALVGFQTDDRPELYQLGGQPVAYTTGWLAGYPLGLEFLHVAPVVFQASANVIHGLTGPGGSGGPVFDSEGRVVGVVQRIRAPRVPTPYGNTAALMGWIVKMGPLDTVAEKLLDL